MKKGNMSDDRKSMITSVCIGTAIAIVASLIIMLLLSLCVFNEYITLDNSKSISVIGQFVCAFIAAYITGRSAYENKIPACCMSVGAYYLLNISISILLFDGAGDSALWGALTCISGCAAGAFAILKRKSRTGGKNRRRHSR